MVHGGRGSGAVRCSWPAWGGRGARGFTLVEGLLAGVILALVGMMIGQGVSQSLRSAAESREVRKAAELLDRTLTKVDLIGPNRVMTQGPTSGRFPPPDDGYGWRVAIESLMEPDLYGVEVTVTWVGPRGERTARAATRLHDPAGSRDDFLRWEGFE